MEGLPYAPGSFILKAIQPKTRTIKLVEFNSRVEFQWSSALARILAVRNFITEQINGSEEPEVVFGRLPTS